MLFSERRRLSELAETEARGQSFWREDVPVAARVKLVHAWEAACERGRYVVGIAIRDLIRHDLGVPSPDEVDRGLTSAPTDLLLSYIEAIYATLKLYNEDTPADSDPEYYRPDYFEERVNAIFNAHRVSYRLVEGEIVPLATDELHVEVVEPTLRLLHGNALLDKAHEAYLKALKEISQEDAPDAITDAGTALQETLVSLGCTGNALGPLIKDAAKRGLLASHDQNLTGAIEKALHWASANRSEDGDAHKSSPANLDDAWLMVHIVGALIVRLAATSRRRPRSDGNQ